MFGEFIENRNSVLIIYLFTKIDILLYNRIKCLFFLKVILFAILTMQLNGNIGIFIYSWERQGEAPRL